MLHKASLRLIVLSLIGTLLLSGCESPGIMQLKFVPEQTTEYISTIEVIKDYRFEQPTLDKLTEQQSKTNVTMQYAQDIQSIDENGNATIKVTIVHLQVESSTKNEKQLSFNSQNDADKNDPLMNLIGKSYTIQMTPDGAVNVLDTKDAMAAISSNIEKKTILAPEIIITRHQIPAIPGDAVTAGSPKRSWSKVVASPPGLLTPKSFEKVYTISKVKNNIATVEMTAQESTEPANGASAAGGMGIFAKMFDNKDDYTGTMQMDLSTGQVLGFEETLVSSYTAQEMPENGDPDKGPDMLLMSFTNRIKLEKVQ